MGSAPPSEHGARHLRVFPPSNGASATHVGLGFRHVSSPLLSSINKLARRPLLYAEANSERFVKELLPFLRFPSVSAGTQYRESMRECARWLANHLKRIGFENARDISTLGHPIVYASSAGKPGRLTLLIYGHYDVQPPDPLDRWHSPPFTPTIRGADLIARGASDDKGPVFVHLKALESYFAANGTLPLNVKCIFEGEEELGSPHFAQFTDGHKAELRSDFGVISDTRMMSPDRPAITYSQRGMLSMELSVQSAKQDLHSGAFGGGVPNAVQVLCEILSQMHDEAGAISIPHFYDRVLPIAEAERDNLANYGSTDERFLSNAGTACGWGEPGYTLSERSTLRPALTFNGIRGGYQGVGVKGVIPSSSSAKLSFRLVRDQDPGEIEQLLRKFVKTIAPAGVRVRMQTHARAKSAFLDPGDPLAQAAAWAYRRGFGVRPVFLPSGGTIPAVNSLKEILGIPVVLMGFALPNDRMHAPNERMYLPNFARCVATSIWFMARLARMNDVN